MLCPSCMHNYNAQPAVQPHSRATIWLAPSACMQLRSCACQRCSIVPEAVSWSSQARLLLLCAQFCCRTWRVRRHNTRQPHRRCGSSQSLQASGAQAFTAFLGAACMCDSTAKTASLFPHSAATFLTSLIHEDTHASMLQMKVLPACNAYIQLPERTVEHTFLVMAFFALGAAAFLGAAACMPEQRCSG